MKIVSIIIIAFLAIVALPANIYSQKNYDEPRNNMVNRQIKARGVSNKYTLNAMYAVKRHLFVPDRYIKAAYTDRPLPIGYGQTISQPYIVGYMTQIIDPEPGFKVLEIGTGSGYQAAVLAEIVDSVYTIEIIDSLGTKAQKRLQTLGYNNIEVKIADGYFGWEEHAPFDAIIVTAAAEYIPPPLLEQLKEGGKMIIPVGSPFQVQRLMLIQIRNQKPITQSLLPVRFVPFTRSTN
jgi:protein-L-isoaspartate(D-aspartate) O-methyltransferase